MKVKQITLLTLAALVALLFAGGAAAAVTATANDQVSSNGVSDSVTVSTLYVSATDYDAASNNDQVTIETLQQKQAASPVEAAGKITVPVYNTNENNNQATVNTAEMKITSNADQTLTVNDAQPYGKPSVRRLYSFLDNSITFNSLPLGKPSVRRLYSISDGSITFNSIPYGKPSVKRLYSFSDGSITFNGVAYEGTVSNNAAAEDDAASNTENPRHKK